ncbi:putative glutamyl-tRNA amidotransferase subunit A [Annulohypoxylon moriforme]|nr:putative glutamyl-tRNA amidotransferase subunit A [Annulohypoxylon moriforme]
MSHNIKFDVLTADLKCIQALLNSNLTTSQCLIDAYLSQIQKHDANLHAMIQLAPIDLLAKRASELDNERETGKLRGPLHGIPIIVKLIAAGAIILGKTNLSWSNDPRGSMMRSGWSAVGGQTMSAYVDKDKVDPTDGKDGHSSPSGSSSGSAVGVSAGYAPVAIGAETDGSLICPAGRAALYTIKPSIGVVSQDGIVPISSNFDSAGPMSKTVYDLAVVLDVISERDASNSFTSNLGGTMEDFSVATLDPNIWKFPDTFMRPVPEAVKQTLHDISNAYQVVKSKAKRFASNVPLTTIDKFDLDDKNSELLVTSVDMQSALNDYLKNLEESEVRSIRDIIDFNNQHADNELPGHHPRQDVLIEADEVQLSRETYQRHLAHLRKVCRDEGIDSILEHYGVDIIIGPADSFITSLATGSGYPIAGMPLSYLDFNGRPLGLAALAGKNQDALLIKFLSAWEATFPQRQPPPSLVE